ncbi:unnamed protein product, partial [Lymnaea stagnalis]
PADSHLVAFGCLCVHASHTTSLGLHIRKFTDVPLQWRPFVPSRLCHQGQVVLEEGETSYNGHIQTPYNGHIQSIDTCQGTVVVYIEELGAKKTVPSSSIRPTPLPASRSGDSAIIFFQI